MAQLANCLILTARLIIDGASAGVAAPDQSATPSPASQAGQEQDPLRTFTVPKPAALLEQERNTEAKTRAPLRQPRATETLRTSFGLGYVQGADWGAEVILAGSAKGIQLQFDALMTKGRSGVLFDHGSISLFDPDHRWRVEAGDVFSNLRGAARGGRLSWQAAGNRHPSIAVYGPSPGTSYRSTVVSYRDQIQVGGQTLLDMEVASDRSYLARTRLGTARLDVEAEYRSRRKPAPQEDASISASMLAWRGLGLNAGVLRSRSIDGRHDWRTISIRIPFSSRVSLTLERAYAVSAETANTTTAAMAGVTAGSLRLFHRHQFGEFDYARAGFSGTIERQQTQSMAMYASGQWLNLALQLATQRADDGRIQHWEELQTTVRLTRTTTLRMVTAVPDVTNARRFRAYFRQELPRHFAIQADYGRLSAFQAVPNELDRARFKVMLYRTWNIATPARGAEVRGRVVDPTGRPISGARVKLGPYLTDADASGTYLFRHVPRGEYELSLDSQFLPADFAWDGRQHRLTLVPWSRVTSNLLVAPLNAIHGRVYCDRNANGRFDTGEGVAGAVVHLDERVTASDETGAYSFYNLWPGKYQLRLNRDKLPAAFELSGSAELAVQLADDQPVTGADFRVGAKVKPIIWRDPRK